MHIKIKKVKKGFTLLEILLVIVAIGILAAIVLVAINPTRQIAQVRNAQRRSDINTIYKALEQYLIDNQAYPAGITEASQAICNNTVTTDCIDLSVLIPTYISSIPKDPSGGVYKVYKNSANNRIGVEATGVELGQSIVVNPIVVTATGGNITTINENGIWYKVHTFTTNGTFTVTNGGNVEYLIVGGGGSGGQGGANVGGGGGGAGGFRTATGFAVSSGTYPVTVGAGSSTANTNGGDSSFSTITSLGGGYGGPYDNGGNGGSGGGGAGEFKSGRGVVGGTGTAGQGSNGARGYGTMGFTTGSGGGGGGAGGPGQLPIPGNATGTGAGGPGLTSSISGNAVTYAAGGMGQSATNTTGTPAAATANTGNGGNAAGGAGGGGFEGPGGSGIVIVRYPTPVPTPSPVVTISGGAALWIDASTLTTGTYNANTNPVNNLGSQGGSFSEGSYSVNTTAINGKPALQFNGIDNYLKSTNAYTYNGADMTIFIVSQRISNNGGWKGAISGWPGNINDNETPTSFWLLQDGNTGNLSLGRGGNGASIPHPGNFVPFISTGVFTSSNITHYLKTLSGITSISTGHSSNFDIRALVLGNRGRTDSNYSNINIGEVIIYNTALSLNDRETIQSYLSAKWSIGN